MAKLKLGCVCVLACASKDRDKMEYSKTLINWAAWDQGVPVTVKMPVSMNPLYST